MKPGVIYKSVEPDHGIIFPLFIFATVSKILKLVVPTEIIRLLFFIALLIIREVFSLISPHSSLPA